MTHDGPGADAFDFGGRVAGDLGALDEFAQELGRRREGGDVASLLPGRVNAAPATADKDLAKLVLALVDLVRQLLERQAIRRVDAGSLTEDEVERMGETFLALDRKMAEITAAFGLEREELNLSLGSIRNLL